MNPFISVFTDTADFTDVDNQLSTDMVSVPREEWEWRNKLIEYQARKYVELRDQINHMLGGGAITREKVIALSHYVRSRDGDALALPEHREFMREMSLWLATIADGYDSEWDYNYEEVK